MPYIDMLRLRRNASVSLQLHFDTVSNNDPAQWRPIILASNSYSGAINDDRDEAVQLQMGLNDCSAEYEFGVWRPCGRMQE